MFISPMKNERIWTIIIIAFIILIPFVAGLIGMNEPDIPDTESPARNSEDRSDSPNNKQKDKLFWGVDSASPVDKDMYTCVKNHFGEPHVWGRYLGNVEGVSEGLDSNEVNYLHDNENKILIIYNHFEEATGSNHGITEAKKAIQMAKDLDIPKGVAIFADIEPDFPVDSDFIDSWYQTLAKSNYQPGIYGVFDKNSKLLEAFEAADKRTQNDTILWTAYPQKKITTKDHSPRFQPQGPKDSMIYGWQYAIDAKQCTIDTNLFKEQMLDYLW